MDIVYQLLSPSEITKDHKGIVAKLLELQGKVNPPYDNKADRCQLICLAWKDGEVIAMGAIKQATDAVFEQSKADLIEIRPKVAYELGYLYTSPSNSDIGVGKNIVSKLMETQSSVSLMATTEIEANPKMVHILESHGFERIGNSWTSNRHENKLGLFIRNRSQI